MAIVLIQLIAALLPLGASWSGSSMCTIAPGSALALVRVERDTTLPHGGTRLQPMSASGVRPGAQDSLLALPGTPMPAGRVTLLQTDSATRALLASHGVRSEQPQAYLRAAPYRADCRTIRWTDTVPFVVRGEAGYVRATLLPPDQWIEGRPVLVVPDAWNYPYPRRRALAFRSPADAPLAPAEALFDLGAQLELPRPAGSAEWALQDSIRRARALAWASMHPEAAELEPVRTLVRQVVLAPDWARASALPSRLRGSYRVDIEVDDRRATWYFRTHDRPGYLWLGRGPVPTTASIVRLPHVPGYRLVGLAASAAESLVTELALGPPPAPLVWLSTTDRPTTPGNEARRDFAGVLEFTLGAVPAALWDDLDAFIPPLDSIIRPRIPVPREREQPRLPLDLRLTDSGGVVADTVLLTRGRSMRVSLQRIDTVSVRRQW